MHVSLVVVVSFWWLKVFWVVGDKTHVSHASNDFGQFAHHCHLGGVVVGGVAIFQLFAIGRCFVSRCLSYSSLFEETINVKKKYRKDWTCTALGLGLTQPFLLFLNTTGHYHQHDSFSIFTGGFFLFVDGHLHLQ